MSPTSATILGPLGLVATLALAGCATAPAQGQPRAEPAGGAATAAAATAGADLAATVGERLDALFEAYFEESLRMNPLLATFIGDDRYDDRLPNSIGPEHLAATRAFNERYLAAIRAFAKALAYDRYFDAESLQVALRAYAGMITYLDAQVGRLLDALEAAGLEQDTRVLYSSDHGESLGSRGLWGKSNMYEESAAIPMIAQKRQLRPCVGR